MSRVSLQNGSGPGSSISLAPETIRVRNALIEKFTDEPLDEMNQFMNTALAAEKNELRRVGILAARIFLLRTRISNLRDFNRDPSLTDISQINAGELNLGGATIDTADAGDDDGTEIEEDWGRLKMTSPGEVQGVRFLPGAIIDAKPEDAEKLLQAGKAVRVDENGNIIDLNEDDFDNRDEAGSGAEAEDRTEGENSNHEARDSDNAETKENTSSAMSDEQTAEAKNDEQPVMAATGDAPSDDAIIAEAIETEQPNSPDDGSSDNADNKT